MSAELDNSSLDDTKLIAIWKPPKFESAIRQARAIAMRYGEFSIVRREGDGWQLYIARSILGQFYHDEATIIESKYGKFEDDYSYDFDDRVYFQDQVLSDLQSDLDDSIRSDEEGWYYADE